MNSTSETTDNAPATSAVPAKRGIPLSRVILLVLLVGSIAVLFWDKAQKRTVNKAADVISDMCEKDLNLLKKNQQENREFPSAEERSINKKKIRLLVKKKYNREVESESSKNEAQDRFTWGGVFYRYILVVDYQKVRIDDDQESGAAWVARGAISESKSRFFQ